MNNALKEKDRLIFEKEGDLANFMHDYYTFDLTDLKKDVQKIFGSEQDKILKEKEDKLREITNNFRILMSVAQQHIAKGTNHTVGYYDEQTTIEQFEQNSEIYENIVKEGNAMKQELRQQIMELDIGLRYQREKVADKQIENKNLQFLLSKEEEMKKLQTEYIIQALEVLEIALEEQLSILRSSAEKITNKVTPYGMRQILLEKNRKACMNYESFIAQSELDLKDTMDEVNNLKDVLTKERVLADSLQREADLNEKELRDYTDEFHRHKQELDYLNEDYERKLKDLEEIRLRGNEDIKRLTLELSDVQGVVNNLQLESMKYECQVEFLMTERDIIVKAQTEGREEMHMDQDYAEMAIEGERDSAEKRRKEIEEEVQKLNREWFNKLDKVLSETERVMSENELKEFRSRIALLTQELKDKTKQIESINKDRSDLEKDIAKTSVSYGKNNIQAQSKELNSQNDKYARALSEKVEAFTELVEAVKQLADRQARIMQNQIEITKLENEIAIMARELEQKDNFMSDLARLPNKRDKQENEEQKQKRMENKFEILRRIREDIRDVDDELEFLDYVKQNQKRDSAASLGKKEERKTIQKQDSFTEVMKGQRNVDYRQDEDDDYDNEDY